MVKGHKDEGGRFHPHTKYKKGVRKAKGIRYANDIGSGQVIDEQVKKFSTKIRDRYNEFKEKQEEEFEEELKIRRKFQFPLINAYRLAQKQNIKGGRDLEKFIRSQIPNLPKDKKTNKFVVKILKDFKKTEQELEKKKRGKSEAEKEALQAEFEDSLEKSEQIFRKLQADQESDIAKKTKDYEDKLRKDNEKLKKQAEESEKRARDAEKARDEARKTQSDPNASQEEKEKAERKAEQSEKEAEQAQEKTQDFQQEVLDELRKEQEEIKQDLKEDEEQGFPAGII